MTDTKFTYDRDARSVTIERTFDAPLELVWKTMTDPELIPSWWGPAKYPTKVDKMDVRAGGSWRFICTDAERGEFAFSGDYLEIDPHKRIVQTFNFEPMGPGHESTETATYEAIDENTTKVKTVAVYKTVEDFDGTVASGMETGARETWERLATLLASKR